MTIADWRMEIDNLDNELLRLLNERAKLAATIGELKQAGNLPLVDEDRERNLIARLCHINAGPLDEAAIAGIFREIISETRRLEDLVRSPNGKQSAAECPTLITKTNRPGN